MNQTKRFTRPIGIENLMVGHVFIANESNIQNLRENRLKDMLVLLSTFLDNNICDDFVYSMVKTIICISQLVLM